MAIKLPVSGASTPQEATLLRLIERALNIAGPQPLETFTVATLPSAATFIRCQIYVSNETGGAVPAFSDGTNWRRVTDRAIVS